MTLVEMALQLRPIIEQAVQSALDDQTALQSIPLFPAWKAGAEVKKGERYQYNGVLYKVVQGHTTQAEWTPDKTPALFVVVSLEEWPEFVQPSNSEDAYNTGDKITYNGEKYICKMDGCVWAPDAYPDAWEKQ